MSLKEFFNFSDNNWNLTNYHKYVSVKCLQSLEDLKKTCDKLGLKFVGYSKDVLKVDFILDDEIEQNQKFYFVKWQGRSNEYNSWEPASRLTDSEDVLTYYTSLKCPSTILSEEMIFYFIKGLLTRTPYDILTITKLYALIYRYDVERINRLDLNFASLKRRITNFFDDPANKYEAYRYELLDLMRFAEKRKIVLSRLKEWETEINTNSPVYVKVENNNDLEGPPATFQFISNYFSPYVDLTENPVTFCSCVNCYENSHGCCPRDSDAKFAYNKEQCLQLPAGYPIYECNKLCNCDNNCTNRVVQHGPKVKIAIFRTKNGRGWGVKTLEPLRKGQFVLEYLGEVITSEHAEVREEVYIHLRRTYLLDMGWKEDRCYAIDATLFGNASHFINHSCDPNMVTHSVWINQQNPTLPRIAFFAKKKINTGEELTFDYKMGTKHRRNASIPKDELISCKCNSKNCRKYL